MKRKKEIILTRKMKKTRTIMGVKRKKNIKKEN
jgi:hypothetical protein